MARFTKSSITWTVKQVVAMMAAMKFIFDNIVQRGYVWEDERMSELIASILEGFPIPPSMQGGLMEKSMMCWMENSA